ncbi:MAG: hypothetical protein ACOYT4_04340 [Nanoarchaeota archaeon]
MKKRISKKGSAINDNLVYILLAVVVIAFLVWGFATGWGNFWDKIKAFGGSSNVDTVQKSCSMACETQNKYDFCELNREIKFGKEVQIGDDQVSKITTTCKEISNNADYSQYISLESCGSLCQ